MFNNLHNTSRKQKVEKLIGNFQPLRHVMALPPTKSNGSPGITSSQWGVLLLVEQFGGSTVKGVAKTLGITSSAATQLIDGLVNNGYIERETHPNDRRAVTLSLSKKMVVKVEKMKKNILQKYLIFFEVLTDREFDQYIILNKKIVDRLLKNIKLSIAN